MHHRDTEDTENRREAYHNGCRCLVIPWGWFECVPADGDAEQLVPIGAGNEACAIGDLGIHSPPMHTDERR